MRTLPREGVAVMGQKVFRVDKDGNVVGIYTDSVPLRELGKLDVKRASNVE